MSGYMNKAMLRSPQPYWQGYRELQDGTWEFCCSGPERAEVAKTLARYPGPHVIRDMDDGPSLGLQSRTKSYGRDGHHRPTRPQPKQLDLAALRQEIGWLRVAALMRTLRRDVTETKRVLAARARQREDAARLHYAGQLHLAQSLNGVLPL